MPSDGVAGMACLDADAETAIRRAWPAAGLRLTALRPASTAEIDGVGLDLGATPACGVERVPRPARSGGWTGARSASIDR